MRNLLTAILLIFSLSLFSQIQYYTTNGKNRLSEAATNKMLLGQVKKFSDILGVPMYGSLTIENTELKEDSIITRVSFDISDQNHERQVKYSLITEIIGRKLPPFDLLNLDGDTITNDILKGKPTLINIWFTACAPCIEEMPILNKIAEEYADKVNFLAVTFEKDYAVSSFLTKHPFNFTHLVDAGEYIKSIGVKSAPVTLFLDKNGVLRYVEGGIPYVQDENGELQIGDGSSFIELLEKIM